MRLSLQLYLSIWSLTTTTIALPNSDASNLERRDAYNPPRNQMYIQTFRNTTGGQFSMLPLIQNPTQLTHLYLAALHINFDPNNINLNDDNPNSTIWNTVWNETAQLQAQGVKVSFMVGGAAKGSYPRLCAGGAKGTTVNMTYYMPLYYTIKAHKIDGINLDIEEQVAYTCPLAILRQLYKDFGPNFLLTMSPVASELQPSGYGLGGFSYKTLDRAAASDKPNGKLINWFLPQFYNGWGSAASTSGYQSIIRNGYAASRVVMGILDSPSDGGSGFYNISTYQKTIKSLRTTYGTSFGGVVGWEYWDAGIKDNYTYPYQWSQTIGTSTSSKRDLEADDEEDGELVDRQASALTAGGDPVSYGPSPWPLLTSKLVGLGTLEIAAVRALNMSNGDLLRAMGILGLGTNLLGKGS